ncbi:MAG: hypothetical protein WD894_07930 [Pirellulales bacterium]
MPTDSFNRTKVVLLAMLLVGLAGCAEEGLPIPTQERGSDTASSVSVADDCGVVKYGRPRELGRFDDKRVSESSGIARSLLHKDRFWTHNDGNTPRLYCIDTNGEIVGIIRLQDAEFEDCEDIASFSREGKHFILYADTGDNDLKGREYRLHLFEEPQLKGGGKKPQRVTVAMTIPFRYPDGSQNCEAVAVDPTSGKVYLATKEPVQSTKIYELAMPTAAPARPLEAKLIARLDVRLAAAMDISPDGRRAMLLTDRAAFEFSRAADEDWAAAFNRSPCRLPTPPRQNGESICYGADGKTLYLTSEGRGEPLWEIPAVE